MATRVTQPEAAGTTKTTYKLSLKNFENAATGDYQNEPCCAFITYEGLSEIKSVEDAIAIRRLASGENPEFDDFHQTAGSETDGMILATTNSSQANKYRLLRAAGFTELTSFSRGPRGRTRTIKLWGARTLPNGKFVRGKREEYDYEIVKI
jgi:hypothetical protein